MMLAGPPCGLFVFLSSSYHRRNMCYPYGDQFRGKVRASNQLVVNFLVLLAVAHARGLHWLTLGQISALFKPRHKQRNPANDPKSSCCFVIVLQCSV